MEHQYDDLWLLGDTADEAWGAVKREHERATRRYDSALADGAVHAVMAVLAQAAAVLAAAEASAAGASQAAWLAVSVCEPLSMCRQAEDEALHRFDAAREATEQEAQRAGLWIDLATTHRILAQRRQGQVEG